MAKLDIDLTKFLSKGKPDPEFNRVKAVTRLLDVIEHIDETSISDLKEYLYNIGEDCDLRKSSDKTNGAWRRRRWDDK